MRKLFIVITLVLAMVTPVSADTSLTALVNATWGSRTVSNALVQVASERAVEISQPGRFSHAGYRTTAEVIAASWKSDYLGDLVNIWLGSPPHNGVLSDHSLGSIGCGTHTVGGVTYGVCVLEGSGRAVAYTPPQQQTVVATPQPVILPDTRLTFVRSYGIVAL